MRKLLAKIPTEWLHFMVGVWSAFALMDFGSGKTALAVFDTIVAIGIIVWIESRRVQGYRTTPGSPAATQQENVNNGR